MAEKALLLLKDDPAMQEFAKRIETLGSQAAEQIDFLKKKASQVSDKCRADSVHIWAEIQTYLLQKGLLNKDDYKPGDDNLRIDHTMGVLFFEHRAVSNGTGNALPTELRQILERLGVKPPT